MSLIDQMFLSVLDGGCAQGASGAPALCVSPVY